MGNPRFKSALLAFLLLPTCSQSQDQTHNTPKSENYNAFEQANNFYSPGILYGVDSDKNSYVVADLTKEAKVEILHYDAAPLFASFEGDNVCLGLVVS